MFQKFLTSMWSKREKVKPREGESAAKRKLDAGAKD